MATPAKKSSKKSPEDAPEKEPLEWPLVVKIGPTQSPYILTKEKAFIYTGRAKKLHIQGKDKLSYEIPKGALVSSDHFHVNFSRGRRLFQKFTGHPEKIQKAYGRVTVIVPRYSAQL